MSAFHWTVRKLVVLALVAGAITVWLNPYRADAAQPYGGCKEAFVAPHSRGAAECRDLGWTVKGWIVLTPTKHIAYLGGHRLCRTEDSRRCAWFGNEQGNGHGLTYWTGRHGGQHYFWPTGTPAGWQAVAWRDARIMANRHHRAAYWRGCVVRFGRSTTTVRCPDGYRYTDAT